MAHAEQLSFVRSASQFLSSGFAGKRILEIGSYNVNGSVRTFFSESEYIGVDLSEGPGVDKVAEGHIVDYPDAIFDITISCECFEHNPYWAETFLNMYRMTKNGGAIIFTCATKGRVEHGTARTTPLASPGSNSIGWDYYKNLSQKDFEGIIDSNMFKKHAFIVNRTSQDLYFIGIKFGDDGFDLDMGAFCDHIAKEKRFMFWSGMVNPINWVAQLVYFPLRALTFLPDESFQKIAVPYLNAMLRIKSVIIPSAMRPLKKG